MAQGGKTLNDRKLAADVRTLTLNQIKKYLDGDDEDFKRQLILRLAPTVLPRIQEISGEDGEPLRITILKGGETNSITS